MSVLSLKNITYRYSGTKCDVLEDLNAEFSQGKMIAIIGKSGSGKSTLLSLISGLDVPTEGTLEYNGQDMKGINRNKYRAQDIGVIFQGFNLLTNATAIDNIVLSMNISGVKIKNKKKEALRLLEIVGINEATAKRKILKLSGGEQQRVGIARAIAHSPKVVVADEPTGNLDGDTEDTIIDILTSLAHTNHCCVIIVTHSKKVASKADEIWGLNGGKLTFVRETKQ